MRIIVPVSPGGGNDLVARAIAQRLGDALGQPFVVDNRPGGSTAIGADLVAKAAPDGYTVLLVSSTFAILPAVRSRLPFDPLRDFVPITQAALIPIILVAHPGLAAANVRELVAAARAQPGRIAYGSSGTGSSTHLAAELFRRTADIELMHVPYKGTGPALTDLLAGQIQLLFDAVAPTLPHIRSGRLKAFGVCGGKRSAAVPELPTVAEAGLPGYEFNSWIGILAPAATPAVVVARLNAEIGRALAATDLRERFLAQGIELAGGPSEQFGAFLRAEIAKQARLVREAGIAQEH